MVRKNIIVYFLIVLMLASPASAAEASLNKWVLNVTLQDDGSVEEIIQLEIDNAGSSSIDGLTFLIPASTVSISNDQVTGMGHSGGQVVEQQPVTGGSKITIRFNNPLQPGEKWNGRITLSAIGWAKKDASNYVINIPIEAPQIIISNKENKISIPANSEIRAQVFFPKSVEVKTITQTPLPRPYKKLFQFNHEVITWLNYIDEPAKNLHAGDSIKIEGSFSEVLSKIVEANEKSDAVSASIKKAKGQGIDVADAEAHINNAKEYLNTAVGSFWKGESDNALQYVGYSNDEISQAENSLSKPAGTTEQTPSATGTQEAKKNPGFEALAAIIAFGLIFVYMRKK